MDDRVDIRVVCRELPGLVFTDRLDGVVRAPVHLGIQKGKEVIEACPANRKSVTFDLDFRLAQQPDGSPNFLGPFAQGTPDDRFFYLSWGVARADGSLTMFRRLKVRLGHLTWKRIAAARKSGTPLTVELRLTTAKDGSPLCGSAPADHVTWR